MGFAATLALVATVAACDERAVVHEPPAPDPPPAVADEPPPPPGVPEPPPSTDPAVDSAEPSAPVLAIDTHVDTTLRMLDDGDDIAQRLPDGHLDLPRMRQGGLSGAFFSIWVDPRRYQDERAWRRTRALIGAVRGLVDRHPEDVALCTTAAEVRAAAAAGRIAVLMGVEGGHALGTGDEELALRRLRELHELGVRYMTITWSTDNPLGHSSTGQAPEEGLTALGRRVVQEMNRLGMIVDVSHVSDQTFTDIVDTTRRPVLASHSSCRSLADHPRNMTDAMIRRVAATGGAVCVNYYAQYIDDRYRARRRRVEHRHRAQFEALEEEHSSYARRSAAAFALAQSLDPDLRPPTVTTVGDHFEHIVRLGGMGAACLGSDFDGVPELPLGLSDVSELPALRAELERRHVDVRQVFGENVLRVLAAQAAPR